MDNKQQDTTEIDVRLTSDEQKTLSDAVFILQKYFSISGPVAWEWRLTASPTTIDPADFKMYKQILVDGTRVCKFDVEDAQDRLAIEK